ncbi:MAG TPA: N-acetylmuramoyl-L-alanine amidase [bacterium]|nr:N-acetylmuramoyl-L-alanine amidase [bacterium]
MAHLKSPFKINQFGIRFILALFFLAVGENRIWGVEETATLKYTYRPETGQVSLLRDMQGKLYLPLNDVAQFYGVQLAFDSQSRKVTLSKGKSQVKLTLSQPVFLTTDPVVSYPLEPVEVVSGQLGIPPEGAEDLFGTLLNISVRFLPDQNALVAGGVGKDEIQKEIQAASQPQPTAPAVSAPSNPPSGPPGQASSPQTAPATVAQAPAPAAKPGPESEEESAGEEQNDEQAQPIPPGRVEENPPPASQVYRVRRIIIDPGHGGRDVGAQGFDKKYCEKQATLAIAKRVADYLKEDPSHPEVFLTRSADYFITLKYRCDFANYHKGDVFVSIHCNANPKSKSTGTEVYKYSARPSNKVAAVAAVSENVGGSDITSLLADLYHRNYDRRSNRLAEEVSRRIRDRLKQHIRPILHAPFYVLRQVDMPSILVETAFITNPKEEIKLRDPYWRDKLAKSIADGILAYRDVVEGTSENQQARR